MEDTVLYRSKELWWKRNISCIILTYIFYIFCSVKSVTVKAILQVLVFSTLVFFS